MDKAKSEIFNLPRFRDFMTLFRDFITNLWVDVGVHSSSDDWDTEKRQMHIKWG